MGGFAGGDEAGYWENDSIFTLSKKNNNKEKLHIEINDSIYSIKAYSKTNEDVYNTISFVPSQCDTFIIEGCDEIAVESNSIYKAYKALLEYTVDSDISDFFYEHKVVVKKRIVSSSEGMSSNAAAFLFLTKEMCNLVLSTDELVKIGSSVDSDVAFFLHKYTI